MKKFFNLASLESLWRAAMFGAVSFFVFTGMIVTEMLAQLGEESEWVNHTNNVIHYIDSLENDIVSLESGQRGYILTREEVFLSNYKSAKDELIQGMNELQKLVSDNQVQKENFDRLKIAIFAREEQIAEVLRLWQNDFPDQALALVRSGQGRRTMDEITTLVEKMGRSERQLLAERIKSFEASRVKTSVLTWVAVIITLAFTFLILYLVKVFKGQETALEKTNLDLEQVTLALQSSESKFAVLAEFVPQFVWICDRSGNVEFFNKRWYDFTGTTEKDNGGWIEVIHPEDRKSTVAKWTESVSTGSNYEVEYRIRSGTGDYRWFIGRGVALKDKSGGVIKWFGTCTDIHEARLSQEEKQFLLDSERAAREEVEKAVRAKDNFVAVLSHELRGPLNAMMGWVQILKTRREEREVLSRGLEVISSNVKIQSQLISDLFDLHRISSGKITLSISDLSLVDIVHSSTDSIGPLCLQNGVSINVSVPESDRCVIRGDEMRLAQVLSNLLSNAVKFTPRGGSIYLKLERVEPLFEITISDTGEGIDPALIPFIFEKFTQHHSNSTKREGGLGLGLSIAKNLVEMHEGEITAFSEGLGKGTTFTVRLPVAQSATAIKLIEPGDETQERGDDRLQGIDILVVEDQLDAREAIKRILQEKGGTIFTASSGEEALAFLKTHKPKCMISDISMGGMDGYTLVTHSLALYPDLCAIALTSFSRIEDESRAMTVGFKGYLVKPIDVNRLVMMILRTISSTEVK